MKKNIQYTYQVILAMFMVMMMNIAQAQTPGGTSLTVELWLKADQLQATNPADGANVTSWLDRSGSSRNFEVGDASYPPTFKKVSMNFNPSVDLTYEEKDSDDPDHNPPSKFNQSKKKLQSLANFPVSSDKSYYIFTVSTVDGAESDGNAVTFSLNARDNWFGWRGADQPFLRYQVDGTTTSFSNQSINYAIASFILPNGTTGNNAYHNGLLGGTSSAKTLDTGNGKAVIGNSNDGSGTSSNFFGEVMEVIVLSSTVGQLIDLDQLRKVHTYLALKYGISMNNNADYLGGNNANVWNRTTNNGYNNHLFGIGRDDSSGFYQKQSTNFQKGTATVFVGSALAASNLENTGTITNGTYLVLGSNDVSGTTSYIHHPGATFQNGSITKEITFRQNRILKAQVSGSSSMTVNLRPSLSALYVLVSANPTFPQANTRIYEVNDLGFAPNVLINSGEYISYASFAVAPGGVVDGLQLWLRPDFLTDFELTSATGNNNVNIWRDYTNNNNDYYFSAVNYSGKQRPTYVACDPRMNFNPSVNFGEHDYLATLSGPASENAPLGSTSFSVYYNTQYLSGSRLYTHGFGGVNPRSGSTRYPAVGFSPRRNSGRMYASDGGGSVNGSNDSGFEQNSTALQMVKTHSARGVGNAGNVVYDFSGYQDQVSESSSSFGDAFRLASGSTLGGASLRSGTFIGLISEMFFYERELNIDEQNKIRSYLGYKYAITLDTNLSSTTVGYNYLLSDGTSTWNGNAAPNNGYHRNIAALVRDDLGLLNVAKARSTKNGAVVTMTTPGTDLCGGNTNSLPNDLSALQWGHNGASANTTTSVTIPANSCAVGVFDQKMTGRIWLTQKTNLTSQGVVIKASGNDFPYNGNGFEVFLLVADSPAKLNANNPDQIITGQYIDGEHTFSYNFTNERTYFTFAAKAKGGNCVNCDFDGVKTIKFDSNSWTRGSKGPNTFTLGDGYTADITVTDANNVLRSRYPRASRSTLRERRKGTGNVETTIAFKKNGTASSMANTFEIFHVDRHGSTLANLDIVGYCGAAIIQPKLSYSTNANRSRYAITNNQANAKQRGTTGSGSSSFTNRRARVIVEFDQPVERIIVRYNTNGTRRHDVGIGTLEMYCPAPLPPPNEDGLIFTKQATPNVLLCEEVNYTFRVNKVNCASKEVNFTDTLPEGMTWVKESVSIENVDESNISGYGTRTLTINNITVPEGIDTYTFRARAVFDQNAVAGTYNNQGKLTYNRIVNGVNTSVDLLSTDRLTGNPMSVTEAADSDRPLPVTTTISSSKSCFIGDGSDFEVTLRITNPNAFAVTESFLTFDFDTDAFTLVPGSVITSLALGANVDPDGLLEFEGTSGDGFSIPNGESIVKFKLRNRTNTIANPYDGYEIDPVTTLPTAFVEYELTSEADDVCLSSTTANSLGELILGYCTYCTQLPTAGVVQDSDFGISLSKDQFAGWPENVPNGFVVLESGKKGMVMTRVERAAVMNPVKGMIIYDISADANCVSIFNGTTWNCIKRVCNQ